MGVAYIVQGANFAPANIGRVTQAGDVPVEALAIIGPSSVTGDTDAAQFLASFIPVNTTERGIVWSIIDGAAYASINASSGKLSVLAGASLNNVTIRATSSDNPAITVDKQIVVSYTGGGFVPIEDLTARLNFPYGHNPGICITDITPDAGDWFKVKVEMLSDVTTAIFGSREISSSDLNSTMFERDATGLQYKAMGAKMSGIRYYSAQEMQLNTRYVVEIRDSGIVSNPSVGQINSGTYQFVSALPIAIGGLNLSNGVYKQGGFDFFGLEIYGANGTLKHRFIPQADITFLDEVTGISYSITNGSAYYGDD